MADDTGGETIFGRSAEIHNSRGSTTNRDYFSPGWWLQRAYLIFSYQPGLKMILIPVLNLSDLVRPSEIFSPGW
jgi:hypothetical protein